MLPDDAGSTASRFVCISVFSVPPTILFNIFFPPTVPDAPFVVSIVAVSSLPVPEVVTVNDFFFVLILCLLILLLF